MFCSKCGREIRDDSVFCSYCGECVEEEPREAGEPCGDEEEAPCVRPGAPKKRCSECGKELPSSTISDLCAMCTIRRRNREIEEERERRDAEPPNRDRYDISDEFDQSVFERDRANYFRGEEPGYRSQERPSRSTYTGKPAGALGGADPKPANRGCLIAAIVVIVVVFVLPILAVFIFSFAADSQSSVDAAIAPVSEASPIDGDWWPDDESDWQADDESEPGFDDGANVISTGSRDELFDQFIVSAAESTLYAMIPAYYEADSVAFHHDREQLTGDGAFITTYGTADLTLGGRTKTDRFEVVLAMSPSYYHPLYLAVNGEPVFDIRDTVDRDGYVTAEGAQFYEREEGTSLFDEETAIRLDDFE